MSNLQAVKFFDQKVHASYIKQMYWIAGSMENGDFVEFISEMPQKELQKLFPKALNEDVFIDDLDTRIEFLINYNKFGFIAEIHHPEHHDFRFDEKGEVKSSSINMGSCRISYAYAETTDELLTAILLNSEVIYDEYIKKDQKKRE